MKPPEAIFGGLAWGSLLDKKPFQLALAGPNGAGKTTFHRTFLADARLPFLNADMLALEAGCTAYDAAQAASILRERWIRMRESFIFETVLSDPFGDKVRLLKHAAAEGYAVALVFIGLDSPQTSKERVAIRVLQGGHDVPTEKLVNRFPRIITNLKMALQRLPLVWVYDNSDLARPYREIAFFENGLLRARAKHLPKWFPLA